VLDIRLISDDGHGFLILGAGLHDTWNSQTLPHAKAQNGAKKNFLKESLPHFEVKFLSRLYQTNTKSKKIYDTRNHLAS
jgi:hypothetical protein